MFSQVTFNELNVLLNCEHETATPAQCANCICGERDEEKFKFVCRYDKILGKIYGHYAAIHNPNEGEIKDDKS